MTEPQPTDGPDYHTEHAFWEAKQMTLKKEQCPDPSSRKFYLVIEIQDFTFDKPLDEFSKAVHKEVTQAVIELREVIQEAYIEHNSAGVWESDKNGTE